MALCLASDASTSSSPTVPSCIGSSSPPLGSSVSAKKESLDSAYWCTCGNGTLCPMYLKYIKGDERFRLCKDCPKCKESIDAFGAPLLGKDSFTEPGKPASDGKIAIRSTLNLCLTCYNKLFAQKRNLLPAELNALGWKRKPRPKPKTLSLEDRIDRLEEYVRSVCLSLGKPFPLLDDVDVDTTQRCKRKKPSPSAQPTTKSGSPGGIDGLDSSGEVYSSPEYSSPPCETFINHNHCAGHSIPSSHMALAALASDGFPPDTRTSASMFPNHPGPAPIASYGHHPIAPSSQFNHLSQLHASLHPPHNPSIGGAAGLMGAPVSSSAAASDATPASATTPTRTTPAGVHQPSPSGGASPFVDEFCLPNRGGSQSSFSNLGLSDVDTFLPSAVEASFSSSSISWECFSCGHLSTHAFNCSHCGTVRCDMRWKNEVKDVTSVLTEVCAIQAKLFSYNDDPARKEYFGVMAQELLDQMTLSNLVEKNSDGFMQVRLVEFVPILLQCVKELNAKVERTATTCCASNDGKGQQQREQRVGEVHHVMDDDDGVGGSPSEDRHTHRDDDGAAITRAQLKAELDVIERKLSDMVDFQLQAQLMNTVYARGILQSKMSVSSSAKEDVWQTLANQIADKMGIAQSISAAIQQANAQSVARMEKMEQNLREVNRLIEYQLKRKEFLEAEIEYERSCASSSLPPTSVAPSESEGDDESSCNVVDPSSSGGSGDEEEAVRSVRRGRAVSASDLVLGGSAHSDGAAPLGDAAAETSEEAQASVASTSPEASSEQHQDHRLGHQRRPRHVFTRCESDQTMKLMDREALRGILASSSSESYATATSSSLIRRWARDLRKRVRKKSFRAVRRYIKQNIPRHSVKEVLDHACLLHVACSLGLLEVAKSLVRRLHMDVNHVDARTKLVPLHVCVASAASSSRDPNVLATIRFLLREGANPDLPTPLGTTALHIAVRKGNADHVKLLLRKGANPNVTQNSGLTPLLMALEKNRLEIVEMLLYYKASVDFSDYQLLAPAITPAIKMKSMMRHQRHRRQRHDTAASQGQQGRSGQLVDVEASFASGVAASGSIRVRRTSMR